MNDFIELKKDEQEVNLMPPLTWAYVGDCVYELYIRTKLVNETKLKPHALHIEAIKHVKAKAQDETNSELSQAYENLNNVSNETKEGLKWRMTDLANDIVEKVLGYRSEVQGFNNDKINEILWKV